MTHYFTAQYQHQNNIIIERKAALAPIFLMDWETHSFPVQAIRAEYVYSRYVESCLSLSLCCISSALSPSLAAFVSPFYLSLSLQVCQQTFHHVSKTFFKSTHVDVNLDESHRNAKYHRHRTHTHSREPRAHTCIKAKTHLNGYMIHANFDVIWFRKNSIRKIHPTTDFPIDSIYSYVYCGQMHSRFMGA